MISILPIVAVELLASPVGGDSGFLPWLTNSILVATMMTVFIIFLARQATKHMELIPGKRQNFFEALVEGLYTMLEGIVGKHLIGRTFSFMASLFIFIFVSNLFGLLPGVGSIGFGPVAGPYFSLSEVKDPLFRPATADLNMTLGLAAVALILWFVWTMQEVGFVGFIKHLFGAKGGMKGIAGLVMAVVFLAVGVLELISIATRLLSLSMRLFGNIFAGENILGLMIGIGKEFHFPPIFAFLSSIIIPIPFYFLELVVALLQAFIFMLLIAVYLQLSTSHDEEAH